MNRLEQALNKPMVVLVVGVVAVALNVLLYFGIFLPRMTPLIANIHSLGTSLPEAVLPEASGKSDSQASGKSDSEGSASRVRKPVESRTRRQAASRVPRRAASRVGKLAVGPIPGPVMGRFVEPVVSPIRRPVLRQFQRHRLSRRPDHLQPHLPAHLLYPRLSSSRPPLLRSSSICKPRREIGVSSSQGQFLFS